MLPKLELAEAVSWLFSFKATPNIQATLPQLLQQGWQCARIFPQPQCLPLFTPTHVIKLNHYLLEGLNLQLKASRPKGCPNSVRVRKRWAFDQTLNHLLQLNNLPTRNSSGRGTFRTCWKRTSMINLKSTLQDDLQNFPSSHWTFKNWMKNKSKASLQKRWKNTKVPTIKFRCKFVINPTKNPISGRPFKN